MLNTDFGPGRARNDTLMLARNARSLGFYPVLATLGARRTLGPPDERNGVLGIPIATLFFLTNHFAGGPREMQASSRRVLESTQFICMLPDLQNLMQLQVADKEILRLKEEVAALPKRVAVIEEKLAATKAKLEKAKNAAKADEATRKKYETAIQDLRAKISKYRDQSLDVKTNEQYKALLHEIQFAEQEIRSNEDRILELMVNAESRDKDVKAAEAELKAETAEIEKEKAAARERTAEDEKQPTEWNGKPDNLRQSIYAEVLRR